MLRKLEPILDDYVPANDGNIKEIEKITNVTLPEAYVDFVKIYGRSTFNGYAKVVTNKTDIGIFTWFGGGGNDGSIIKDIKDHKDYAQKGFIPIADDMFNNRFVLNGGNGEISFIEYSSGNSVVIKVADSFEEFVKNIKVEDDE